MANTLVQFRSDEAIRIKASDICKKLGIDLQTYLRMCLAKLVQENGIPFSLKLDGEPENKGLAAMKEASKIAHDHEISEVTLDEINAK